MTIEHCRCDDCIVDTIERLESLTAYAARLESLIRVADKLFAEGEIEAARGVIIHAAKVANERDVASAAYAAAFRRDCDAAADRRAANRLH